MGKTRSPLGTRRAGPGQEAGAQRVADEVCGVEPPGAGRRSSIKYPVAPAPACEAARFQVASRRLLVPTQNSEIAGEKLEIFRFFRP